MKYDQPYIAASRDIDELTLRAVTIGLVLSIVMCAANIYVGLYAGMTVSAAIPASVISMGILRGVLRRGTILENNIVHTIASSGESLAAGIIFTVPALVLLGLWDDFSFWETTLIAMAGGVMGVVMMIPLRKPMVIDQPELKFPEGVACAEVLKAGDRGGAEMQGIFVALAAGAFFKFLVSVVGLLQGTVEWATRLGRTGLYVGTDISPMLMAVGFIVGWEISLLVFLGGAISFLGAIPAFAWGTLPGDAAPLDALMSIWDTKIRFFGIGAMIVAGVYSITKIAGSTGAALRSITGGVRAGEPVRRPVRTEQGIAGAALSLLLVASLGLSGAVYFMMTRSLGITLLVTGVMAVLAFFFVAVASYIVGLVGSSNSPVSGMTICTVLVTSFLLLLLGYSGTSGMLAALGVAGVVCCAACTSGDICQDLKIGYIIGATPRRQQTAEVVGTIVPAFIVAPTMQLLHRAYGIGTPAREGVAALKAPQGVMFEKLVGGIFGEGQHIPWDIVGYGAAVGAGAIVIDLLWLAPRQTRFRLHAMPLAVGMYLPWTVTFPILLGGFAYWWVEHRGLRRGDSDSERQSSVHRGLLFSSGLVAGEAIMGIAIAGWVLLGLPTPLLATWNATGGWVLQALSLVALLAVTIWLVRTCLCHGRLPQQG
ncbi:MAG: oligopeptide transporter, OPT family [Planctomycetales bacterium]|nr:oligopeptide transporter, OPT family [Planctomycetales bacterium]